MRKKLGRALGTDKWNISCGISKQKISQPSEIAALFHEPVSPKETQNVKIQDTGSRELRCI